MSIMDDIEELESELEAFGLIRCTSFVQDYPLWGQVDLPPCVPIGKCHLSFDIELPRVAQ